MDGEGRKMKETERGEKMRERIVFVRTFNERDITLLSVCGKIYAEILVDRVHKVTEGLIDDV